MKNQLLPILFKKNGNPVFIGAGGLIFFILALAFLFPNGFFNVLSRGQNVFILYTSWFYVFLFFLFFCLCIYLALSPYGRLKMGAGPPKYNNGTWIAMIFSAGMGTGLLFSGVYEPLYHYFYPPSGPTTGVEPLPQAFQLTFLHWGFSGWAIYTLTGIIMAYFSFCRGKSLKISSIFSPFLKGRSAGFLKSLIDIVSVVVILIGMAVTLGRGSMQINSGLKELWGISYSSTTQTLIIFAITVGSALSLISGLNKGIRRLSELNLLICLFLLLFVFSAGPTVFVLSSFVEHSMHYLLDLIKNMTRVNSLGSVEWRSQWTLLYLAWWVAWTPFTGLFIARISKGRSVRQIVLASLLAPAGLSCFWFAVFGGSAIEYHLTGEMNLQPLLKTEYSLLLFEFLKHFPFSKTLCITALLAIVVFFVTSSDSASYVIHQISSRKGRFPLWGKLYWASLEGLLAIALLYLGGIKALELLLIVSAFPLLLLIALACFCFLKELRSPFPP